MKAKVYNLPDVKLADFEGPLDLLLHLIRQSQMSIYDIRISEITSQYLQYLHTQETLRLNIAGEYLVMAAKLTEIKGKMLLPHEEGEELVDEDPRTDLVDQLIEYQIFKTASENLRDLEGERQRSFSRPEMEIDPATVTRLAPGIELTDLQKALQKVLARQALLEPFSRTVQTEKVSIEEQMDFVKRRIQQRSVCRFEDLFTVRVNREVLVTTFMAILELAKNQQIKLSQDSADQSITIKIGEVNEQGTKS